MPGNNDPRLSLAAMPDQSKSPFGGRPPQPAAQAAARGPMSLLLHVCCGPCAIMPLSRLLDEGYAVTAWFMNPNIQPLAEYLRRREAAGECAARLGVDMLYADEAWDITAWLRAVAGRDTTPARCAFCCESRLAAAFAKARESGFAWVSTSLLYSRYQPHETIAAAGRRLTRTYAVAPKSSQDAGGSGPAFLYRDFRPDWQAGIDRSKAWGLYRQPYCGCVYSEADRYHKQLARVAHGASGH